MSLRDVTFSVHLFKAKSCNNLKTDELKAINACRPRAESRQYLLCRLLMALQLLDKNKSIIRDPVTNVICSLKGYWVNETFYKHQFSVEFYEHFVNTSVGPT